MPLLRRRLIVSGLFALSLPFAMPVCATAETFQNGDLVAGTSANIPLGVVLWYRNGVLLSRNGGGNGVLGLAFDRNLNLYVTDGAPIDIYDRNFRPLGVLPVPLPVSTELVFDAAGNAYVGLSASQDQLAKVDSSGSVIRRYDLSAVSSVGVSGIDLAADQCTLYIVDGGSVIRRLNVCTGLLLPDLTALADTGISKIRILPDGSILVSARMAVYRLDPNGRTLRTYTRPNATDWAGLTVDPNGRSFWSSSLSFRNLTQFTVDTGDVLNELNQPSTALAVVGEPRAAASPAVIPVLNPWALFCLAGALGLLALARLSA